VHGVTVIWYPLKDRATHRQWKAQLRKLGIPKLLVVEHWLYDSEQPGIYSDRRAQGRDCIRLVG